MLVEVVVVVVVLAEDGLGCTMLKIDAKFGLSFLEFKKLDKELSEYWLDVGSMRRKLKMARG